MKRLVPLLAFVLLLPAALAEEGHVHTNRPHAKVLPLPKENGVFHFLIFGDRTGGPKAGLTARALDGGEHDLVAKVVDPALEVRARELMGVSQLEQMKEYRGIMDKLHMPWYPVAGIHDVYWRPERLAPPGQHEASYEEHFGGARGPLVPDASGRNAQGLMRAGARLEKLDLPALKK